MKSRKVVVCIDDMKNFLKTYEKKESFTDELNAQDVTFLHVFEKTFYNDEFSQYSWPSEDLYSEIKEKVNERLKKIADGFLKLIINKDSLEFRENINRKNKYFSSNYNISEMFKLINK